MNFKNVSAFKTNRPKLVPHSKTIALAAPKHVPDHDLEGALSDALMATDKELAGVVREIDQISRALQADSPALESLKVALHPAVWCALKHVIMEKELRYLALTDDLTCLYNRRGFFAAATQQLKVARRSAQGVLLLFCDVNKLKAINDSYGHREGDSVLVRTADALEKTFRDSDILARLGGDEFAVLAPEASFKDEAAMWRRLEKNLKKENAGESRYELSLSVGMARYDPQHPVSLAELVEKADADMYEQKRRQLKLCLEKA